MGYKNNFNDGGAKKFRGKYRIPSARLQGYDYSRSGAYFITICTKYRRHFFGEIVKGRMQFSDIGEVANNCWEEIPDHFPFVKLGAFVVMPDHVHGVIFIDDVCTKQQRSVPFLGAIVRGFKIGVTKYARKNTGIYHIWQPRFHDRVIRDEPELNRITQYIINNPKNWVTP